MIQKKPLPDQELVSCEVCLKSIPVSEAKSSEAEDYVAYFCGLDCYDLWVKQAPKESSTSKEPKK